MKTYKPIPESRNYTRDELIDAGKLAQIIVSVPSEKKVNLRPDGRSNDHGR